MKNYKTEINNLIDNEPNFNGQTADKIILLIREIVKEVVGKMENEQEITDPMRMVLRVMDRNQLRSEILSNVEEVIK